MIIIVVILIIIMMIITTTTTDHTASSIRKRFFFLILSFFHSLNTTEICVPHPHMQAQHRQTAAVHAIPYHPYILCGRWDLPFPPPLSISLSLSIPVLSYPQPSCLYFIDPSCSFCPRRSHAIISTPASLLFFTWLLSDRFAEVLPEDEDWRHYWWQESYWHMLFFVILLAIVFLWRPTNNNARYVGEQMKMKDCVWCLLNAVESVEHQGVDNKSHAEQAICRFAYAPRECDYVS